MRHVENAVVGVVCWFAGYGTPRRPRLPPRGLAWLAGELWRCAVCFAVLALLWFFLAVAQSIVEGKP